MSWAPFTVLEAARHLPGFKAILIVTSDNDGGQTAFREDDRLGGDDPYSSSKAPRIPTGTASSTQRVRPVSPPHVGNVFGGGDWARDRLAPDAVQAFLAGEVLRIRNPARCDYGSMCWTRCRAI